MNITDAKIWAPILIVLVSLIGGMYASQQVLANRITEVERLMAVYRDERHEDAARIEGRLDGLAIELAHLEGKLE